MLSGEGRLMINRAGRTTHFMVKGREQKTQLEVVKVAAKYMPDRT
jgi:hypothetical protein